MNTRHRPGAPPFNRDHIIFPKRHFIELSFCWNANWPNCYFAGKKITESHLTELSHGRIVELVKLHNAERHFSESLFSRTTFSRIVVQLNVIFTNRSSAERRFTKTSFTRTEFCRNRMKQNVTSPNTKYIACVHLCSMCLSTSGYRRYA